MELLLKIVWKGARYGSYTFMFWNLARLICIWCLGPETATQTCGNLPWQHVFANCWDLLKVCKWQAQCFEEWRLATATMGGSSRTHEGTGMLWPRHFRWLKTPLTLQPNVWIQVTMRPGRLVIARLDLISVRMTLRKTVNWDTSPEVLMPCITGFPQWVVPGAKPQTLEFLHLADCLYHQGLLLDVFLQQSYWPAGLIPSILLFCSSDLTSYPTCFCSKDPVSPAGFAKASKPKIRPSLTSWVFSLFISFHLLFSLFNISFFSWELGRPWSNGPKTEWLDTNRAACRIDALDALGQTFQMRVTLTFRQEQRYMEMPRDWEEKMNREKINASTWILSEWAAVDRICRAPPHPPIS